MRPLLVAAACVLVGLAAGAVWTWAQPERYRADARLLVRPASAHAVAAVETLAESSTVRTNVAETLRLGAPPHVTAHRGEGGVLTVSVEAGERERARQIDAEAVTILQQKVEERFARRFSVVLLDPAHAEEQTSPNAERNLVICGLAGLALGVAAAGMSTRGEARSSAARPGAERRLEARIAEVTRREVELARHAGELAARERALAERDDGIEGAATPKPTAVEVQTEYVEQPPEPELAGEHRRSRWNLIELERRVAAQRDVSPELADEWHVYLPLLRSHADVDGNLPDGFDGLLNDVFAALAPRLGQDDSAET